MVRYKYTMLWRNKWITGDAKSISDMIASYRENIEALENMAVDGVILDPESGIGDDYAELVTNDPEIAKKYGFNEDEDEDEDEDELN